jgi:predicted secreted protein
MAQKDGRFIVVKFGNTTYAGQTETSIDMSTDAIDVTTKTSGGFKEYIPGEIGGTIAFSGLQAIDGATDVNELLGDWKAKTVGAFVWGASAVGSINITGQAFLSALNLTGTKNEGQGFSGTLQITGEISSVVVS